MSSSSSENKNRIFDLCQGFNPSFAAMSNRANNSTGYNIVYNGKVYRSVEEFDVNEMPRSMFMDKPNVVMAYEGTKVINGVDTGVPCVVVGVSKKDPNILASDMVPPILPDGVLTDIIITDEIFSNTTCTDGSGGGCADHAIKHRPLIGGISAMEETGTACTLGLIVKDSTDGSLVSITNNHCSGLLYDAGFDVPDNGNASVVGLNMLQPSPVDGGTSPTDDYGQVKRAVPMQFGLLGDNNVDASISSVGVNDASQAILDINEGPFSFAIKAEYDVSDQVYKSGRTTGVIPPPVANITSMLANVNVNYGGTNTDNNKANFTGVMLMGSASRFSQGGDSGAPVLVSILGEFKVAGLNFAGNSTGTVAVACHMDDVAAQLQVEEWDGSIIVPPTTANSISVNGFCYIDAGPTEEPVTHNDISGIFTDCLDCETNVMSSSSSTEANSSSSNSSESTQIKSSSSTVDKTSSSSSSESSDSSLSSEGFSSVSHSSKSSSSTEAQPSSQSSSSFSSDSSSSSSIIIKSSSSSSLSSDFDVLEYYVNNAPVGLEVDLEIINGKTVASLSWDDMKGAVYYIIERKEGFTGWDFLDEKNSSSYNDLTVVPGRYYSYRVSAVGEQLTSGNKVKSLHATTTSIIFTPITPSNLDAKVSRGIVRLSWSDNSTYENGFIVKRKYQNGSFESIYSSRKNNGFFVDSNALESGEYTYVVNSYVVLSNQTRLDSPDSNEASVSISINDFSDVDNNIYIEFGEERELTIDNGVIFKVEVLNAQDEEYFWFINNENVEMAQFGNLSYFSTISSGDTTIVVRDVNDNTALLNVSINNKFNFTSPIQPTNINPIRQTESMISISWNYVGVDINNISHFDIYRLEKIGTNSANSLINPNNTSQNKVNSVANSSSGIFSYTDFGLTVGASYFYTVVTVSKNGKTSLFATDDFNQPSVIEVSTINNNISIIPSQSFVEPSEQLLMQGLSTLELTDVEWNVLSGDSKNKLIDTDSEQNVIFEASDKWITKDIVEITNNDNNTTATSRIIVTKII